MPLLGHNFREAKFRRSRPLSKSRLASRFVICNVQLLSFWTSVQGATWDWQGTPSNRCIRSSAAIRPTLWVPWDREVMRGVVISLYWLLSKLTTAISSGMETPRFTSWATRRLAISSL